MSVSPLGPVAVTGESVDENVSRRRLYARLVHASGERSVEAALVAVGRGVGLASCAAIYRVAAVQYGQSGGRPVYAVVVRISLKLGGILRFGTELILANARLLSLDDTLMRYLRSIPCRSI